MNPAPDAYTVAASMLGGKELSPTHVAQLRAINRKYYQRMLEMLEGSPGGAPPPDSATESPHRRALTPDESAELEAMLTSDVRAVVETIK